MCSRGEFAEAAEACDRLLIGSPPPQVEVQARVLAGQALALASRPAQALEHLNRAKEILASHPDTMLAAECADWEACCLYLLEDNRAASVAEQALAWCHSLSEPAPLLEARILEHLGSINVRNHAYDSAIAYYKRALAAAGAVRDLRRLARINHGLGVAYDGRGERDRAIVFVRRALLLYRQEGDLVSLARAENELGLLLMRCGQLQRAEELFVSALSGLESSGSEMGRSHILLSLGELYLSGGRVADAIPIIRDAIERSGRLNERLAESTGHHLLGEAMERLGLPAEADDEYRLALDLLRNDGLDSRLIEVHVSYASMLERRSDLAAALGQLKQAADIASGQTSQNVC
ncbi:MAG TPA: tetratricopeptide repeat protein [Candidatus Dormibacteraeota bacterium]|nr:tetratricopeptide repeat protein [Candidatus Dormibacteraeota bacterium]